VEESEGGSRKETRYEREKQMKVKGRESERVCEREEVRERGRERERDTESER